jgi:tripartite-type tricarboxylate transporter receptor subunit TctC
VPARTPAAVIERLNRELAASLQTAEMKETARIEAYTIIGGTPAQFAAHLKAEHAKYARLIKDAGIKGAD